MLRFQITNKRQRCDFIHSSGPIELGRAPREDVERFAIEDRFVSRSQLRLEETPAGSVFVENLGSNPMTLNDGATIAPDTSLTVESPIELTVGYTRIKVSLDDTAKAASIMATIAQPIRDEATPAATLLSGISHAPSADKLAQWFETLIAVQRSAAGSDAFYEETARAVVELIGLQRGMVILRDGDRWNVQASYSSPAGLTPTFSQTVLNSVMQQRRTFFESSVEQNLVQSLTNVEAYVASPIFDEEGQVVGTVFGSRDVRPDSEQRGIAPLEAQLVQCLAGAVSAGLARMESEFEAARSQVQLEQFASRELVRELKQNPTLLEPSTRDLTILFADLRGFSRLSERLGAQVTYRLVQDVMERLTQRVVDHDGFIIHYAGDGLAAMWNAPADQSDHAQRACRAALAMHAEMPAVNEQWCEECGCDLEIGVGINTGLAQVGNAGSRWRLKYAPLGHNVNLASRVEGATKHLGVRTLITKSAQECIADEFATRRLCKVRVIGIDQAIELFELHGASADDEWLAHRDAYERALSNFESGQLIDICDLLMPLREDAAWQRDRATEWLWSQATCVDKPREADCIFELDSK